MGQVTTSRAPGKPRPPRQPAERRCKLLWAPHGQSAFLDVQVGNQLDRYWIHAVECSFGLGFKVEKLPLSGGVVYYTALDLEAGRNCCECPGFSRWNHCKHVEAILALAKAGRIPLPAQPAKAC
jgi:hypothetical protein